MRGWRARPLKGKNHEWTRISFIHEALPLILYIFRVFRVFRGSNVLFISVHSCSLVVHIISLLLKDMSVNSQAISLERMDLSRRNGRIPTNEMPFSSV